jgi:hypothetical protein
VPKTSTVNLDLLYPFYLDTDMCMAFAAALTGGVTMEVDSKSTVAHGEDSVSRLQAGLKIFEMLDVGGRRERTRKRSATNESHAVRHHTEASILINLVQELSSRGLLVEPDLDSLTTGQIVSMEIGPATAPLLRVVNQILRLLELMNPEPVSPPVPPQAQAGKPARATPKTPVLPPEAEEDPSVTATRNLFRSLRGDLEFSGMTDIVVRREGGLSVVLTLDNRFITDQALELLHTSSSRVIGKVTQIWHTDGEFVNLYRRSVLSLVPALPPAMGFLVLGMLGAMGRQIDVQEIQRQANEAMGSEVPDPPVQNEVRIGDDFQSMFPGLQGPALQILPLAVCA